MFVCFRGRASTLFRIPVQVAGAAKRYKGLYALAIGYGFDSIRCPGRDADVTLRASSRSVLTSAALTGSGGQVLQIAGSGHAFLVSGRPERLSLARSPECRYLRTVKVGL